MSNWQPAASWDALQRRAQILRKIREFFYAKGVLEVETPLLAPAPVTDPFIESISAQVAAERYYLQTSPEYAMKRLLAAGSGSIYQICKAFRQEESGQFHNPEFTMLEWYRIGFTHYDLMAEMDELLQLILQRGAAKKFTYQAIFMEYCGFDPEQVSIEYLQTHAEQFGIYGINHADKDTWLNLYLTHHIEPQLQNSGVIFIYDYPVSQAALAKIIDGKAARFEVYVDGLELANGFYELTDAKEQEQRFLNDLQKRQALGLTLPPIDNHLLAALQAGLPACAGVALGLDRLIMSAYQADCLADVISFPLFSI